MRQAVHRLGIVTRGRGLTDVTADIRRWTDASGISTGLLTVFRRLVPESVQYRHGDEGSDDMPAHIRAALTRTQLSIPIAVARRCREPGKPSISMNTVPRPIAANSLRILSANRSGA